MRCDFKEVISFCCGHSVFSSARERKNNVFLRVQRFCFDIAKVCIKFFVIEFLFIIFNLQQLNIYWRRLERFLNTN